MHPQLPLKFREFPRNNHNIFTPLIYISRAIPMAESVAKVFWSCGHRNVTPNFKARFGETFEN